MTPLSQEDIALRIKQFVAYLRKHDLSVTNERVVIYQSILQQENHFRADELFELLKRKAALSIARGTVYNTLNLLIEAGMIVLHKMGSHWAEYETVERASTHYHLICLNCGKIKEVEFFESEKQVVSLRKEVEKLKHRGFKHNYYSLYIYGFCQNCKNKKVTKKNTKTKNKIKDE